MRLSSVHVVNDGDLIFLHIFDFLPFQTYLDFERFC